MNRRLVSCHKPQLSVVLIFRQNQTRLVDFFGNLIKKKKKRRKYTERSFDVQKMNNVGLDQA